MEAIDTGECRLCGGSGEVTITPIGEPDSAATSYGCPVCIAAARDEEEAELLERIDQMQQHQNELLRARQVLGAEVHKLQHQRDQLLAAAEAAYELLKVIHDETGKVGLQLRAAIAATKGGA